MYYVKSNFIFDYTISQNKFITFLDYTTTTTKKMYMEIQDIPNPIHK